MIWVVFFRIISPITLSFRIVTTRIASYVGVASWRFRDLKDNIAVPPILDLELRLSPIGIYLSS